MNKKCSDSIWIIIKKVISMALICSMIISYVLFFDNKSAKAEKRVAINAYNKFLEESNLYYYQGYDGAIERTFLNYYSLLDIENDGIPELLVSESCLSEEEMQNYDTDDILSDRCFVLKYLNGKILYIGSIMNGYHMPLAYHQDGYIVNMLTGSGYRYYGTVSLNNNILAEEGAYFEADAENMIYYTQKLENGQYTTQKCKKQVYESYQKQFDTATDYIKFYKNTGNAKVNGKNKISSGFILKKGKQYSYDIDGDGKKERIKFKEKMKGEKIKILLWINNKKAFQWSGSSYGGYVFLCDINKKDKYYDFYITCRGDSGEVFYAEFLQYRFKKMKVIKSIRSDGGDSAFVGEMHFTNIDSSLEGVNGDGTFAMKADSPCSFGIGTFYCYVPFEEKKGKIKKRSNAPIVLAEESKRYLYTANKKILIYRNPDNQSAVVGKWKSGDILQISKIKLISNNAFAYAIGKNGVEGWIKLSKKKSIFVDVPVWG